MGTNINYLNYHKQFYYHQDLIQQFVSNVPDFNGIPTNFSFFSYNSILLYYQDYSQLQFYCYHKLYLAIFYLNLIYYMIIP